MKRLLILSVACVVCILSGGAAIADTVGITPTSEQGGFVSGSSGASDWEIINSVFGLSLSALTADLLYKADFGRVTIEEDGTFKSSYDTLFLPPGEEPNAAVIAHVTGQPAINGYSSLYLVVKDGAHGQFAFNLLNLTANVTGVTLPYSWNGIDTISLSGFYLGPSPDFPTSGSISHVSIIGIKGTTVPEPGTLALLGLGLLAGGWAWRRRG